MHEVVEEGNNITGNKIKFEYTERRVGDAEQLISNVDKIKKHIEWEPKYNNLSLIISSAINWEKKIYEENL